MDADLTGLVGRACEDLGYTVEADFIRRKDFVFSWGIRSGRTIVNLPDYVSDAPRDILCSFGRMVAMCAHGIGCTYPDDLVGYLGSDAFVLAKRPVYISRSRNLTRSDMGEHRFIPDSVDRLLDSGLLHPSDIDNSWFSWTRHDNVRRLGFCSRLFRTVGISSILDDPGVPDALVDFVVYHECLHLRQGYTPSRRAHDRQFRGWEHEYPDWKGCEAALRRLGTL